ncbi:histidinol phosphate phosphatase H [Marasmius fiardii PR-910]|nr:histidinol phosphate phosphatase H [Marasmius fiardii PR-910]
MPYSHHSHSGQFCKHAQGTLEEVVLEAIRQGFEVYGLTEHVPRYRSEDLYPEEQGLNPESLLSQFDGFIQEAHRLKSLYAPQITLLVGLETEFITPLDLDRLDELLSRYSDQVEYLVGSIHHVHGVPIDFDIPTYEDALRVHSKESQSENETMERFLCSYFEDQYEMLTRFEPEIVGHIDLCRLYDPALRFSDFPRAQDLLKRNIKRVVGYGGLFEVNAAAFRKNWDTAYPGEDVLQMIVAEGGRFALSDDSHGPHAVGLNYHRMAEYLETQKVSEIWFLQHTEQPTRRGRSVQAVLLPGNWRDHVFWKENTTKA